MVSPIQFGQPVLNNTFPKTKEIGSFEKEPSKPIGFQNVNQDGLSFLDLIDIVNPAHHIPIIGPIYRIVTGDIIKPLPRIAGSALYGGPIGVGLSAAEVILEAATGRDSGAHILTLIPENLSNPAPATSEDQKEKNIPPISEGKEIKVSGGNAKTKFDADPVSAWARAEIAYRSGLAARQELVVSKGDSAL